MNVKMKNRPTYKRAILGLGLGLLMATSLPGRPVPEGVPEGLPDFRITENPPFVKGEVIVKLKQKTRDFNKPAVAQAMGLHHAKNLGRLDAFQARTRSGESVQDAIQRLRRDPRVAFAEPNYIYRPFAPASAPNDPEWSELWALQNTGQTISPESYSSNNPGTSGDDMDMLEAWGINKDCSSTIVAVIDTGVNYNHEDLSGNMWDGSGGCKDHNGSTISGGCPNHGWDYASSDNNPMDEQGHGSHVAAIIGAEGDNGLGGTGVCQTATIMAVRVLGHEGGTSSDIAQGIQFAVENGAKVINLSLGGFGSSSLVSSAIADAEANDVVVITAAGNESHNLSSQEVYPCAYDRDNILCVAALDQSYSKADFSNYDTRTTSSREVDLGAPGTNILSVYGDETIISSTSMYTGWSTSAGYFDDSTNDWLVTECGGYDMLAIPDCTLDTYLFGSYGYGFELSDVEPDTDRRIYKTFSIDSNAISVVLNQVIVSYGRGYTYSDDCLSYTSVHYDDAMGDPVDAGLQLAYWDSTKQAELDELCGNGNYNHPYFGVPVFYGGGPKNLEECIGDSSCTVGFRFESTGIFSYEDPGAEIYGLSLTIFKPSNNAYDVQDGTSMAAPYVAGLAALIRSQNPGMTAEETIQKIIDGGESNSSLSYRTKYGVSVNAGNSMKHINQVTGVTATLQ